MKVGGQVEKEISEFSLLNGYAFNFKYQDHDIKAWFSALTGAEKVYLDGELVASQRNLKRVSQNTFAVDGTSFSTSMSAENIFKGPYTCTLLKEGNAIKKQHLTFPSTNSSKIVTTLRFIFYVVMGYLFGTALNYYKWPFWTIIIFLGVLVVISHTTRKKYLPVIEEENCV